jgi:hypothetical protein
LKTPLQALGLSFIVHYGMTGSRIGVARLDLPLEPPA